MTGDDYLKIRMVTLACQEELSRGVNSVLASLLVMRNRVESGQFGDYQRMLDTYAKYSSKPDAKIELDVRNRDVQDILGVVDSIYDGTRTDNLTEGSLYHGNPNDAEYELNGWFDREIARKRTRKVIINGTLFY